MEEQNVFGYFLLLTIVLIVGVIYFSLFYSGSSEEVFEQNIVEQFTVHDTSIGVRATLPALFTSQPTKSKDDFYSADKDCRLSFDRIVKKDSVSLEAWLAGDAAQLSFMTVHRREIEYLNLENTKAIYLLETEETGLSRVYYEDVGDVILQAAVYSESSDEECYRSLEDFLVESI